METQRLPTGCVVVGVDAAQPTDRALDWAADQAALEQRPLLLVHGIGSPLGLASAATSGLDLFPDLQAAGHALLARATTRAVTRHPELVVHQSVRPLDPRQALLDRSDDAALVVVGSRGRGHVLSVALGSVSEEVLGRAACPVVVVRPHHGSAPRRGVLVGTDGTGESEPVLQFAFRQARLRGLPLTVLHTVSDAAVTAPAAATPSPGQAIGALSGSVLAAQYSDVVTSLEVGWGTPGECLVTLADSMDLVVVGHHQRGTLGRFTHNSVAVAVLEQASVAIAVVPVTTDNVRTSVPPPREKAPS